MSTKVLDTYALVAFFEGEVGSDKVRNLLIRAEEQKVKVITCSITIADVWLSVAKAVSSAKANECIKEIEEIAIEIVSVDLTIARQAAEYQKTYHLPVGDSYSAALAKVRRGELITGHSELKTLEEQIKISWIA